MKTRTVKISKLFIVVIVFLFLAIIIKLCYVSLSPSVDGISLKTFASNRNTAKETLIASRGIIYDKTGEILARNINSYTVIAYLEPSRTTDSNDPQHVVDKKMTAEKLSPLINMTEEKILSMLESDVYQIELGPGGRNITQILKEEIEALDLPGISFIKSVKRYYPKSDFLSYTIGYAKTDEKSNISGEMGIEQYYNEKLSGTNGYKEYQQDMFGYQIAGTDSLVKEAEDGVDIYLTIDTNIQMFVEQQMDYLESSSMDWATISVMDAKTGEILGVASSPSFNPNTKNIKNYYDPFVSFTYEPGSTMKIFSFLAAMENNMYDGKETYKSGNIVIDDTKIEDWNKKGWGEITYDEGFAGSSNVAAAYLSQKLGKEKLRDMYEKLGFGYKTGITLPNEQDGTIGFKYNVEVANAAFGQGMTITHVQMLQALSAIANDGKLLAPYIVDKIVNKDGEIVYDGQTNIIDTVASPENTQYIKTLMKTVVDGSAKTSYAMNYNVEKYDLIGKTGTAEIASSGGYLSGTYNFVRSFAGMFPGKDPQIIFYVAVAKTTNLNAVANVTKSLVNSIGTYLNINNETEETLSSFTTESYVNKNITAITEKLSSHNINTVVLGNGDTIINQYPQKGVNVNKNEKIILLTNDSNITYPNIISWSKSDVEALAKLLNINVTFEGYGYVTQTNIEKDATLNTEQQYNVSLKPLYEINEETS